MVVAKTANDRLCITVLAPKVGYAGTLDFAQKGMV